MALTDDASEHIWTTLVEAPDDQVTAAVTPPTAVNASVDGSEVENAPIIPVPVADQVPAPPVSLVSSWADAPAPEPVAVPAASPIAPITESLATVVALVPSPTEPVPTAVAAPAVDVPAVEVPAVDADPTDTAIEQVTVKLPEILAEDSTETTDADQLTDVVLGAPGDEGPDHDEALEATPATTAMAVPPPPALGGSNLAAVRALNPASTAAQHQLEAVVMAGSETLSRRDRTMIALVVSIENRCDYWIHHLARALETWTPTDEVAAFVADWNGSDLGLRERAMLAFAVKLCLLPGQMNDQDARLLGSVGFSDTDLIDIVDVVAYWGFAGRVVDGLGVYVETTGSDRT